jgi:hypothetical protein
MGPSATDEEITQALEAHHSKTDKTRAHPYQNTRSQQKQGSTLGGNSKDNSVPSPPVPIPANTPPVPNLTPFEAIETQVDPSNNDMLMEDVKVPSSNPSNRKVQKSALKKNTSSHQSAVSSHIDKNSILNKVLNANTADCFPISVGELLACSPEISNMLTDVLKFQNPSKVQFTSIPSPNGTLPVNLVHRHPIAKSFILNCHRLICFMVMVDGKPIEAIPEGSMLNIVHKAVW